MSNLRQKFVYDKKPQALATLEVFYNTDQKI